MNFRKPNYLDIQFLTECYASWPVTETNPPVYETDIRDWITRWMNRTHDNGQEVHALMIENPAPIGYFQYRVFYGVGVYVDNLIIHPSMQGQGLGTQAISEIKQYLVDQGAAFGEFESFGKIAEWVDEKFERVGTSQGKIGPLVRGRITADMEL